MWSPDPELVQLDPSSVFTVTVRFTECLVRFCFKSFSRTESQPVTQAASFDLCLLCPLGPWALVSFLCGLSCLPYLLWALAPSSHMGVVMSFLSRHGAWCILGTCKYWPSKWMWVCCEIALQDLRSWKTYSTLDLYQCRLIDLVIIAVQDSSLWVFHSLFNHFLIKGNMYCFQSLITIGTSLTALGHASFAHMKNIWKSLSHVRLFVTPWTV